MAEANRVAAPAVVADSLAEVYRRGQSWSTFYDGADQRRELWVENWTNARVPEELASRARRAGPWRILVITEARCSDSVNSVPYIAKLVEEVPGLELKLVNSTVGRPWMEAHRTADGRAATPTVLVLDDEYRIRGCWIEQPVALQAFWLPIVARGTMSQEVGEKMAWYAKDGGREILREFVEVLEGASSGNVVCPGA
jgi:hypothetical protein